MAVTVEFSVTGYKGNSVEDGLGNYQTVKRVVMVAYDWQLGELLKVETIGFLNVDTGLVQPSNNRYGVYAVFPLVYIQLSNLAQVYQFLHANGTCEQAVSIIAQYALDLVAYLVVLSGQQKHEDICVKVISHRRI